MTGEGHDNVVALHESPSARRYDAIVEGLRRREPQAINSLFDQFGAQINRLVWRLLGADQEHNDVVHDVFSNILTSVDSLQNPALLGAWINRVTVFTVRKEIRRRRVRRVVRLGNDMPTTVAASSESPEEQLFLRSLYRALGGLRADDRIAILLRYMEGHSVPEVARMCAWSVSTAKRRIERARGALRKRAMKDPVLGHLLTEVQGDH